jgi:daunorubicin resistance ABC transporter ATP-binding subunit
MIEARGLAKSFGPGLGVSGIDLQVPAGTIVSLLGPNGAGKTTIVRMLATLLRPDAGWARVAGHDVVAQGRAVRRRIGLTGQLASLDDCMTGRANLVMLGQLSRMSRRQARARAADLLTQFGLESAAGRAVRTYSGGMRRRLDLAASLVGGPAVLFLDEPTTGLDPDSRRALWEVVRRLAREGTTVLLTTQYLEEADRLADQAIVVDHGRLIAQGTPATLKADLGTTVLLVTLEDHEHAQRAAALLAPIGNRAPIVEDARVEMNVENGPKAGSEAMRALDARGIDVLGLVLREPSLDDVFLQLTGHRAEIDPVVEANRERSPVESSRLASR